MTIKTLSIFSEVHFRREERNNVLMFQVGLACFETVEDQTEFVAYYTIKLLSSNEKVSVSKQVMAVIKNIKIKVLYLTV